jgi:hypothetical protein
MRRLHLRFPQNALYRPVRHPFTVDSKGDWERCTATLPKACVILGTVTSEGSTGALVRMHGNGNLVKVVNGRVSIVNALKVRQALNAYHEREIEGPPEMVPIDEFHD